MNFYIYNINRAPSKSNSLHTYRTDQFTEQLEVAEPTVIRVIWADHSKHLGTQHNVSSIWFTIVITNIPQEIHPQQRGTSTLGMLIRKRKKKDKLP